MTKKENFSLYQTQIQTDVAFTAFMTAVVIFFTGLLLTKFSSFDTSIKVPISFLIISTFGFLYASLILTNAAAEVSNKNISNLKKHLLLGYTLSEYIGVYLLILSIPLIINVITDDLFLRIVTLASSMIGLAIYQFSHFSMLERHFKKGYNIISGITIFFGLLLFFSHLYKFYFVHVAISVLIYIMVITYSATRLGNSKK